MAPEARLAVSLLLCCLLFPISTSSYSRWGEDSEEELARSLQEDKGTHEAAYIVTVNSTDFQPGDRVVLRNLNGTEISSFESFVEPAVGNTYFHSTIKNSTFCWIAGKNHEVSCSHYHTSNDSIKSTFGRAHATSPFLQIWGDHIVSNSPEGRDVFKYEKHLRNTTDVIGLKLKSAGVNPTDPFGVNVQLRLVVVCSVKEKAIKLVPLDPGSDSYESISYADMEGDCSEIVVEPTFRTVYFFQGRFLRAVDIHYPGMKPKIRTTAEIEYPYFKSLSCVYLTCAWVGGLNRHGEFVGETKRTIYWLLEGDSEAMLYVSKVYAAQPGSTILQVQRIEDRISYEFLDYCLDCRGFCFTRTPWSQGSEFPGWMNCYCPTSGKSVEGNCRVLYSDSPPEHQRAGFMSTCHQGWIISMLVIIIVTAASLLSYYIVVKRREPKKGDDEPLVDQFEWASSQNNDSV